MKEDTLHIVNDEGGLCDECCQFKATLYLSTKESLCPECYIEHEVPEASFSERLDCAWLWSKENQCVEGVSLATLTKCGWFVAEKVIDHSERVPKATYKLKYYGKKACPRCTGVDFSENTEKCPSRVCSATVERGNAMRAGWDNFDI